MNSDSLHLLALHLAPGIGPILARQLLAHSDSVKAVFKIPPQKLAKIPGIGPQTLQKLSYGQLLRQAENVQENALKDGIQLLAITEADYPQRLKQIPDAPIVLFYKGQGDLNPRRSLSIVGTRKATEYGRHITEKLIEELTPYHPTIISGLAYGIDIQAHRSALKSGLSTLAVFACGLDTIYPSTHRETALQMQEKGGIISEQLPGTGPESYLFPVRNRIIAGLSDATIVIEAAAKGGAVITAKLAFDYNREVFAVPGDIGRKYSEGCLNLVKQHMAHICTSAEDIGYILGWEKSEEGSKGQQLSLNLDAFQPEEQAILSALQGQEKGISIDELSFKSQISMNKTASLLLTLECQGLIKALPGKRFKLMR